MSLLWGFPPNGFTPNRCRQLNYNLEAHRGDKNTHRRRQDLVDMTHRESLTVFATTPKPGIHALLLWHNVWFPWRQLGEALFFWGLRVVVISEEQAVLRFDTKIHVDSRMNRRELNGQRSKVIVVWQHSQYYGILVYFMTYVCDWGLYVSSM